MTCVCYAIFLLDDMQNWQSSSSGPRIGEFRILGFIIQLFIIFQLVQLDLCCNSSARGRV